MVDPGYVDSTDLGGVPRKQKMLKGHRPRVVYHRLYLVHAEERDAPDRVLLRTPQKATWKTFERVGLLPRDGVPGGGHLGRDAHRGQGCVRHGWVAVVGRSRIGCFSSFASDFFSSSSLLLSSLELSNTGTRRREIWGATCSRTSIHHEYDSP